MDESRQAPGTEDWHVRSSGPSGIHTTLSVLSRRTLVLVLGHGESSSGGGPRLRVAPKKGLRQPSIGSCVFTVCPQQGGFASTYSRSYPGFMYFTCLLLHRQ